MTGWTIAKYVFALAGLAVVIIANQVGRPAVGYGGLVLMVAAFLLRFLEKNHR